jgi:hypothetical protein
LAIPVAERKYHRKTAVRCFNRAWDYLEMKNRTPDQEREMLQLAHASRHHWSLVGSDRNRAVGDWQISRVYGELGHPRLSLQYAKACLAECTGKRLTEITPTAYEAMARAYAVGNDFKSASKYLEIARRQLAMLDLDTEDRRIFKSQIDQTESLMRRRSVKRRGKPA